VVTADRSGILQRVDAKGVGVCAWRLGAGRSKKEDDVSMSAGVMTVAKPGDEVGAGDTILELHVDDPARLDGALDALDGAIVIGDEPPEPRPLVAERITAGSVSE
jgi:thymidine phosphorylase